METFLIPVFQNCYAMQNLIAIFIFKMRKAC